MTADAVIRFFNLMEAAALDICLDGGWGVDALMKEQTRHHNDLDIILNVNDLSRLVAVTQASGYVRQSGGTATSFVLKNDAGDMIDVHAIPFDERGYGVFTYPDGRKWPFPPAAFHGRGEIQGKAVRCLSPDAQVQCHGQGYTPDKDDLQDMQRLQERFGVVLPLVLCRQG